MSITISPKSKLSKNDIIIHNFRKKVVKLNYSSKLPSKPKKIDEASYLKLAEKVGKDPTFLNDNLPPRAIQTAS